MVDSGHEHEITSVPVAAQQVEVFTKVLMTTIQRTIDSEPDEWQRNVQELVVCLFERFKTKTKNICFYS